MVSMHNHHLQNTFILWKQTLANFEEKHCNTFDAFHVLNLSSMLCTVDRMFIWSLFQFPILLPDHENGQSLGTRLQSNY